MNKQMRRVALLGASTKTLQFAAAYGAVLAGTFSTANESVKMFGTSMSKPISSPTRSKMIDKDEREIRKKRRKKSEASRKRNRK